MFIVNIFIIKEKDKKTAKGKEEEKFLPGSSVRIVTDPG
jgi:hypothetical protein